MAKVVNYICDKCKRPATKKLRIKLENLYVWKRGKYVMRPKKNKHRRGRAVEIGIFCDKCGNIKVNSLLNKLKEEKRIGYP